MTHWIIPTVGKHIIAQDALTSRDKCIGIDESTQFGIVITGLEIVERGFSILGLTAIPDYPLNPHTKPHGFRVGIL